MASLTEIRNAGLNVSKTSGFGQILNGIKQGLESYSAGKKEKMQKDDEALTLYTKLREAGYSEADAKERVQQRQSGSFLDKIFGAREGFQPPTEYDPFKAKIASAERKARKEEADIKKTEAEAYGTGVYNVDDEGVVRDASGNVVEGGKVPKGAKVVKRGTAGRLTENQRQEGLREKARAIQAIRTGKAYDPKAYKPMRTFESKDDMVAFISQLNVDVNDPDIQKALAEKYGEEFPAKKVTDPGVDSGKVLMKRPDGATVRIKSKDVTAAVAAGYKKI